jgi:hypothetical protein
MSDVLKTVEFRIGGEVVESVRGVSVPSVGDTVEVGARFDSGGRLDPSASDVNDWYDAEYRTVLEGCVDSVTRHYHTGMSRNEETVYVDVDINAEVDDDE